MELRLNHVKKSFGDKTVLDDCSFVFQQGKIYGLLGRNGAGKTTLFNCLSDEIQPDMGNALICDDEGSMCCCRMRSDMCFRFRYFRIF
ncbi:MAG: ATP-binding cassette domain-containing protein [Sellimonas intestinalis]